MAKAIKRDSGGLIDHDARHRSLVASIMAQLTQALPSAILLRGECENLLTKELRAGKAPAQAVEILLAEIKANPRKYILLPFTPDVGSCYSSCRSCRGCCP
jgi:hypothetical protein